MSDELEITVVEGVIQDDHPYTDAGEAEKDVTLALALIERGQDAVATGHQLLVVAERRQAWKVLGYDSMAELISAGLARFTITQERRIAIAADLRKAGVATGDIAKTTGVSYATAQRDVRAAREAGRLADEPERVVGADGRVRPTSTPERLPRKSARRPDLSKSWGRAVDELAGRIRALVSMREDDRYRSRRADLLDGWSITQIQNAHTVLGQILAEHDQLQQED